MQHLPDVFHAIPQATLCSLFKFSNYILDPPLIITHVIIIISVIIITVSTWNSLSNEKRW